jgi:hypothetical protein
LEWSAYQDARPHCADAGPVEAASISPAASVAAAVAALLVIIMSVAPLVDDRGS